MHLKGHFPIFCQNDVSSVLCDYDFSKKLLKTENEETCEKKIKDYDLFVFL